MNIEIPSTIRPLDRVTYMAGFGAAVTEFVSEGDCDDVQAAHEAENWTATRAYLYGYRDGMHWAAAERRTAHREERERRGA